MGHAKRDDFLITQEGEHLYWTNTVESPIGTISIQNTAQVSGTRMTGISEMIEGPMEGKTFTFTGTKIEE